MGIVKNLMMEHEEEALRTGLIDTSTRGQKFVSAAVTDDIYIKNFINANGIQGTCSYTGNQTKVIDIIDLELWAVQKIKSYFQNPDNDGLFLESTFFEKDDEIDENSPVIRVNGYATSRNALFFTTEELLYHFDFSNNNQLIKDIANNIYNTNWININSFDLREDQNLSFYWNDFAEKVKETKSYIPSSNDDFKAMIENSAGQPYDLILYDITNIILENQCFKILPSGTKLYRCRNINNESEIKDKFKDMTSAPAENAFANRMSKKGDSMFYAAFSKEVSLKEAVDQNKPIQALAEFVSKKEIGVVDLTNLPTPSIWADSDMWGCRFLHIFTQDISENFEDYSTKDKEISYIPTQVFTQEIRRFKFPSMKRNVDGLIYYSSKIKGKQNIVLFIDNNTSEDYVEITNIQFYHSGN